MRPIFTVHAGEYLVGAYLEQRFPFINVWIPSQDTGIDLLLTNRGNSRSISLQVKFSKDFSPTHTRGIIQQNLKAAGWWTHKRTKLSRSIANYWVFVLPSFTDKDTSFIVIPPSELERRLNRIHRKRDASIQSYLWVTSARKCWETRDTSRAEQDLIAINQNLNGDRDFSEFLNNWQPIVNALRKR